MVLTPCDAVSIDREGFAKLAAMPEGVPLDSSGRRQVLFSHLPEGWVAAPDAERRVEALFDGLDDRPLKSVAGHLTTVNTPEELDAVRSRQQRGIERDGC